MTFDRKIAAFLSNVKGSESAPGANGRDLSPIENVSFQPLRYVAGPRRFECRTPFAGTAAYR
jgi:hypothetical protein